MANSAWTAWQLHHGDGVGITDARELDIRFDADSEVLLFDVRMDVPLLWR